jgi:hypothetical protein
LELLDPEGSGSGRGGGFEGGKRVPKRRGGRNVPRRVRIRVRPSPFPRPPAAAAAAAAGVAQYRSITAAASAAGVKRYHSDHTGPPWPDHNAMDEQALLRSAEGAEATARAAMQAEERSEVRDDEAQLALRGGEEEEEEGRAAPPGGLVPTPGPGSSRLVDLVDMVDGRDNWGKHFPIREETSLSASHHTTRRRDIYDVNMHMHASRPLSDRHVPLESFDLDDLPDPSLTPAAVLKADDGAISAMKAMLSSTAEAAHEEETEQQVDGALSSLLQSDFAGDKRPSISPDSIPSRDDDDPYRSGLRRLYSRLRGKHLPV